MKRIAVLFACIAAQSFAAPPSQNDVACRLASGTGPVSGCGASDITTEATPASGDWALGWDASGALRKYDLSALLGGGGSSVTFGGATYTDLAAGSNVTFAADGDGTATINVSSGSATVGDGDYGDITVSGSGATWAVDSGAVAFSELSGAATDAQIPNNITVDLATVATTANAGDSATAFFSTGTIESARLPDLSSTYQPADPQLNTWAGVTPGTGVETALAQTANAGTGVVTADNIGLLATGTAAPSTTPSSVGDLFVDTSGDDLYFAVGTASSADWIQANGGTGSMVYPGAGVAVSTGSSWGASLTASTLATLTGTQTLTGKTINAGSNVLSGIPWQQCWTITAPADADDLLVWREPTTTTLTAVNAIAVGGGSISVDLHECDSAGATCATVLSAAITANGGTDAGTISDSTLAAGGTLKMVLGAPTGTVDALMLCATGTQSW